jgi:hypothetical protein
VKGISAKGLVESERQCESDRGRGKAAALEIAWSGARRRLD